VSERRPHCAVVIDGVPQQLGSITPAHEVDNLAMAMSWWRQPGVALLPAYARIFSALVCREPTESKENPDHHPGDGHHRANSSRYSRCFSKSRRMIARVLKTSKVRNS